MNTPDVHQLQRHLAQAWAESACWACTGKTERLQDARFVIAMLTLRIRHRQGLAGADAAPPATRSAGATRGPRLNAQPATGSPA